MAVSAEKAASGGSSKAFLTSLVANVGLLSIEVGAFVILKARISRIYSPRTFLPPPEKRSTPLPMSYWKWLPAVIADNPEDIIHKNGLDAYMFLRFIKMLVWIFAAFTVLTMAVIVPLNTVNVKTKDIHDDLDKISWINITDSTQSDRYAGHIVMVYILTFGVCWLMHKEMLHFVHVRHKYLNSKLHSKKAQARTVLVMGVPDDLSTERDLRVWASFAPGGIDRIWLYHEAKALNKLFEDREDACSKLEDACIQLLRHATLNWRTRQKTHKHNLKMKRKQNKDAEIGQEEAELHLPDVTLQLIDELVPVKKRPTARTGFLGIFGNKVSSFEHHKTEIARLTAEIDAARKSVTQGKFMGSAFIRTNIQMGATVLAQVASYHEPGKMVEKWMETNPKDVVWSNLDDGPLEMKTRQVTSWIATAALIIGWIPPAAFIGGLSNSQQLCKKAVWLEWICTSPDPVPGIITGILPPLLLAIVFAVLPIILRALAWYECIPRYSLISVSVYRRFYLFLLIHGFLIVTLSSGLTKALEEIINNPTTALQALAARLPGASSFFLTYIITQGLAGAATALLQLVPIILYYIKKFFLGRTPRQAYNVTFMMPMADFGLVLPRLSLLATIGFTYSVLTPFINVVALVSFMMTYLAWKYLLTQVMDQPDSLETAGVYYPMAMQNLFVGLYIEHICLACLFFLKATYKDMEISSIVEGVTMIVLLLLTVFFHAYLRGQFDPISNFLPMSLATKKLAKKYGAKIDADTGQDIDLFAKTRLRKARNRMKLLPKALDNKLDSLKAKVTGDEPKKSWEATKQKEQLEQEKNLAPPISEVSPTAATSAVAAPQVEGLPELFKPPSVHSNTSVRSRASKRSNASKKSEESKTEKRPVFDPPAPALSDDDDDDDDDEDSDDEHAFDHPATYKDQPFIWIPEDPLGLSKVLVEELKKAGVSASDLGSTMSEKGVVEVSRGPPDEDWYGGHDH